jgi:hypothetical protein
MRYRGLLSRREQAQYDSVEIAIWHVPNKRIGSSEARVSRVHNSGTMKKKILRDGAPRGTCSPPWVSVGFGIPNRLGSLDPLVRRVGRDHQFPVYAGSAWRERDIARRVGHG